MQGETAAWAKVQSVTEVGMFMGGQVAKCVA